MYYTNHSSDRRVHTTDFITPGERDVTVVRALAHGAMRRRIDPKWGGPIEVFLIPASAARLV